MHMDMRRSTVLPTLLLITGIPMLSIAQTGGVGIKAGATYGKLLSEVMPAKQAPGATIGLYLPLGIGPRWELQAEVLATAIGSGLSRNEGIYHTERLLYLQLPASAKYYFGNSFNLQGGPQLGFLLKAWRTTPDGDQDVRPQYNNMDIGANMGMGIDLRSGLDLTLRYHYGITPVMANDQTFFPRNRYFQFTVGYRFSQFKVGTGARKRS